MSEQVSAATPKFNFTELKTRATVVLTNPKGVWSSIRGDGESIGDLYKKYFIYMAAIPPVCMFLGMAIFGMPVAGPFIKISIFGLLVHSIFQYCMALLGPIIGGTLSSVIAPNFGGSADKDAATKLFVYSATASQIGGLLSLIPALSLLAIVPGIYSLYTAFQGITPMTDVPGAKRIIYIIAMLVAMFVVMGIISFIGMSLLPAMVTSNFNATNFGVPG